MISRAGWRRVKFGDMAENVTIRVDNPSQAGVERYVGLEHLDPESLAISRWGHPTEVEATKLRFWPGDIIFGRRRAYQRKLAVADFEGICSAHALVLRAKPDIALPEFLPFFMQSDTFHDRALAISVGSLSPTINWKTLKEQEFDLPPIDEQREIAAALHATSSLAIRLLSLSTALERSVSALRDQLCAPDSAQKLSLNDVSTIASQNGLTKVKKSRSGSAGMINMGQIFGAEEVDVSGAEPVELTVAERTSHLLQEGDLLFARRSIVLAGAGKCSIVPAHSGELTFESSIIRVRLDRSVVDPRFLLHYFRSCWGRAALRRIARPGPVAGIAGSDLRKMSVPLPDLPDQRRIVQRIEDARNPTSALDQHRHATSVLRRELLGRLLRNGVH